MSPLQNYSWRDEICHNDKINFVILKQQMIIRLARRENDAGELSLQSSWIRGVIHYSNLNATIVAHRRCDEARGLVRTQLHEKINLLKMDRDTARINEIGLVQIIFWNNKCLP